MRSSSRCSTTLRIEFIGEIGEEEKEDFLGEAYALIFPIDWPEPFGLVMIEALACGTPVVAFKNGSAPEVVDHGLTGFIVETIDEAVEAVQAVSSLSRRKCRRTFEARFTDSRMVGECVRLYEGLLCRKPPMVPIEGVGLAS